MSRTGSARLAGVLPRRRPVPGLMDANLWAAAQAIGIGAGLWVEPPIGIEPMTYALREARWLPAHVLAARIPQKMTLTALAAMGLYEQHSPVDYAHLTPIRGCLSLR